MFPLLADDNGFHRSFRSYANTLLFFQLIDQWNDLVFVSGLLCLLTINFCAQFSRQNVSPRYRMQFVHQN